MPITVKKVDYQLQLSDSVKTQYPNDPIVRLLISQLADVSANIADGHYLVKRAGVVEGTAVAPGAGGLNSGTAFPVAPADGDIFLLTRAVGQNAVGIYQYSAAAWIAKLTQVEVEDIPQGAQLPGVVSGLFILTAKHLQNEPGFYATVNNAWQRIAGIYDDTAVRALITALTARVGALEGDNPVTTISIAGTVLTFTQKDGTTTDLDLPSGTGGGLASGIVFPANPSAGDLFLLTQSTAQNAVGIYQYSAGAWVSRLSGSATPTTSSIIYGLTAGIDDIRDDSVASANAAQVAALAAFNLNNSDTARASVSGLRLTRVANNLSTGSYVNFSAPAAPAEKYYNPWIVVPAENFTFMRVVILTGEAAGEEDSQDWVEHGEVNIAGSAHKLFVKKTEIESDADIAFSFKIFR